MNLSTKPVNPHSEMSDARTGPPPLAPRAAILQVEARERTATGRRNRLRLDLNENTAGSPVHVLDFLQRYVTAADLAIYPEYDHALEDLALHFSVEPGEVTLTNGTEEAIQLLINTYVNTGEDVLMLRPSYDAFKFYSQLAGARLDEIDYRPGTLAFPLEELLDRIGPATRAVLIANPNSPTGTGIRIRAIEQILTKSSNAAVLIDEAYYEFSGATVLPLIHAHPNLFVSRSFSTVYGMAAMRCACLFSQAENMAHVRKAQSPYSVNSLAAMAARIAVQDRKFVEAYVLEVLAARELLYVSLERLRIPYIESQANFVLFQAGPRSVEICDELRDRGVLVRDCSSEIPGCIRLTLGTRDQVQQFLHELEQIW